MSGHGIRARRLGLGAAVATCALLGALAGSASATLNLDRSTDTSFTVDGDTHYFSGNQNPVTRDGYQYFAYWDAEASGIVHLKVTRRRLSDDNAASMLFDQSGDHLQSLDATNDGHNNVGLGISPADGRLHISWSNHTSDRVHNYLISSAGCTSLSQASFTFANCRFTKSSSQADATHERRLTYPTYFNDNGGTLYFSWRYDASSRGDQYLNVYDDDGTWTSRGRIMQGRDDSGAPGEFRWDPDGAGPLGTYASNQRGVYVDQWEFDKNDHLHVMWRWRENITITTPTAAPGNGQHGVNYAYSDDHGETWYSSDGTHFADADTDTIKVTDTNLTEVVSVPPNWWLGTTGFELDSNNQPHLIVSTSDVRTTDSLSTNQRQQHFWRLADGTWHSQFVESSGDGNQIPTVGDLMFDQADIAYFIFGRNELGWVPYNSGDYVQNELPTRNVTWQNGGYMDVQLHSTTTGLNTDENVDTAISTAGNNQVRIRMMNDTAATDFAVWWTTSASQSWSSGKSQTFRTLRTRQRTYSEYTFTITDADWSGTLRELAIYPAEGGVSTGSQSYDWIKVTDAGGTAAKTWDFDTGMKLVAAEAAPHDNWATWNVEDLLTSTDLSGSSIQRDDGWWRMDRQRYVDDKVVSFGAMIQGAPGTESLSVREFDISGDDLLKDWRFDADLVGWEAAQDVSSFAWANDGGTKGAGGTITGSDPGIVSMDNLKIPIDGDGDWLHVRMKNTSAARTARMWFITDADRRWNPARSASFAITANSGYTLYDVDMSSVSGWDRSTLHQVVFDPADDGTSSGSFKVDRIYISDTR